MIIKVMEKQTKRDVKNWLVFDDIKNYRIGHNTELASLVYELSFKFDGNDVVLNLMEYDKAFIMNNDGKTIDTLRNIDRTFVSDNVSVTNGGSQFNKADIDMSDTGGVIAKSSEISIDGKSISLSVGKEYTKI